MVCVWPTSDDNCKSNNYSFFLAHTVNHEPGYVFFVSPDGIHQHTVGALVTTSLVSQRVGLLLSFHE